MSVKKSENNVEKWEKWKNEKPLHGRCGGETLIRRLILIACAIRIITHTIKY